MRAGPPTTLFVFQPRGNTATVGIEHQFYNYDRTDVRLSNSIGFQLVHTHNITGIFDFELTNERREFN